jgi:hypothetical protein
MLALEEDGVWWSEFLPGGVRRAVFCGVGGEGSVGLGKAGQGTARPSVPGSDVRRVTMAKHA